MRYQLPNEETLGNYMCMLRHVLLQARLRAYKTDPQIAELLDAVENVPDLLLRWKDMDESIVIGQLHAIEASYPEWRGWFTSPLENGAPDSWQLKRTSKK
jgi:hypothetical protein